MATHLGALTGRQVQSIARALGSTKGLRHQVVRLARLFTTWGLTASVRQAEVVPQFMGERPRDSVNGSIDIDDYAILIRIGPITAIIRDVTRLSNNGVIRDVPSP